MIVTSQAFSTPGSGSVDMDKTLLANLIVDNCGHVSPSLNLSAQTSLMIANSHAVQTLNIPRPVELILKWEGFMSCHVDIS